MTVDLERVRRHFDEEAAAYDTHIERIVPHYREQHDLFLQLLPFGEDESLQILDLGCGTGALSHVLLVAFPRARVVALDLSEGMLEECGRRLARVRDRATLRRADFGTDDLGEGYDLVVSGLAIHHLTDGGKRDLYGRILGALRPGGVFLNREIVLGATPAWTRRYEDLWRRFAGEPAGSEAEWFRQYREEDLPASVEDQLDWLRAAGFVEVACHYRHLNFALFGGSRPE